MKAVVVNNFGGTENLEYLDIPTPEPAAGQVQVLVKAIGINPVDAKTRAGSGFASRFKDRLPAILGWDISGIVTKVGEGVTRFKQGDAVFGMLGFPDEAGAYAEYVVTNADYLALKPENISHEEAAATTLAALTAYQSITHTLNVQAGNRVVVYAAAGGVGHYAVQIAKHLGAYVIGTSSAANKDFVLGLGADEHIDYHANLVEDVAKDIDVVLDSLGGENIDKAISVLKPDGKILSYPGATAAPTVQKATEKGRNGYTFMVYANGDDMAALATLLQKGIVKPYISQTFGLQDIVAAHNQIASGKTIGKIVVIP